MTKIIFGINVPYPSTDIDWDATETKRKEMVDRGEPTHFWDTMVRVPCIRTHKEMSFELCDICGTQVVNGRAKRNLTTCCPEHNKRKWDAINGLVIEREKAAVGERPYHFWQTIRWECFERDKHTCQKCGVGPKKEMRDVVTNYDNVTRKYQYEIREISIPPNIEVHHIVPLSKGGNNQLENLITLCYDCHKKEHAHDANVARRSAQIFGEF